MVEFDELSDMTVEYNDFTIQIGDDENYTIGSVDNLNSYKFEYINNPDQHISSNCGIKVYRYKDEIASAVLSNGYSSISVHEKSCVTKNERLFICCGDGVFCLSLPELDLKWFTNVDTVTCFGIYEFEDDLIIHGEVEITRLTKEGIIKWQFSGRDIFVTPDGKLSFELDGDLIRAVDFEYNEYVIDGDGKVVIN